MRIASLGVAGLLGAVIAGPTIVSGANVAAAVVQACPPATATVLERSGSARLYSSGGQLYGCLGMQTTRLGALAVRGHFGSTRVAHFALAGHYAGIDTADMGIDTLDATLGVFDLATGHRTAIAAATSPENRAESFISASSLAIDSAGTLAWVGARSAVGAFTPIYEVRTLGARGDQLLDSGAHIKAGSLTLRGHRLSWSDGGHERQAELTP
jgi:hypothetical protein